MTQEKPSENHWLVRTVENLIAGPYSLEQVQNLIQEGQLDEQDEVCEGNGHWFFLYETQEVEKQLGITLMPKGKEGDPDEEDTQTGTHVIPTSAKSIPTDDHAPIPDLPQIEDFEDQTTAYRKEGIQNKPSPSLHQPQVLGKLERSSAWKIIAMALVALIVFSLLTLLNLTGN